MWRGGGEDARDRGTGRRGAVVVGPDDRTECVERERIEFEVSAQKARDVARLEELESELAVLRSRVDELERVVRRAR